MRIATLNTCAQPSDLDSSDLVLKPLKHYSYIQNLSVFKFCVIGGIFLTWFADALLFDMMIKTSYRDGVNTHQDLIDRGMFIGEI